MTLRPWQVKSAQHLAELLRQGQNCVDMSDGGTGKTYTGCAVANMLRKNTVAIVPKISVSTWQDVSFSFGHQIACGGYEHFRTGKTALGQWENPPPAPDARQEQFVCQSCLQTIVYNETMSFCPHHPNGLHCLVRKKVPWRYGKFIWNDRIEFLIFDEIHRCSALDSLNADMLIAARRQGIPTLGMSATAACTPLQMRALGYLLGLHGLDWEAVKRVKHVSAEKFAEIERIPNWKTWAYRQGCRYDPNFHGLVWQQPEERKQKIIREIRSDIIPACGVRVTTAEIPNFPKRIISAEVYDIDKPGLVDKLYVEMAEPLADLAAASADDIAADHPLTKLLRARQRLELLKMSVVVELAQDELAKGKSVAIFVNFKQTVAELAKKLKTTAVISIIEGGQNACERDSNIARFQDNTARVIIANIAAGGQSVSLHDLDGSYPRIGLVMPNFSAVQMLQVFFRLAREGGKSTAIYKIILAAGSVERHIQKSFDAKRECLEALNDFDLNPNFYEKNL